MSLKYLQHSGRLNLLSVLNFVSLIAFCSFDRLRLLRDFLNSRILLRSRHGVNTNTRMRLLQKIVHCWRSQIMSEMMFPDKYAGRWPSSITSRHVTCSLWNVALISRWFSAKPKLVTVEIHHWPSPPPSTLQHYVIYDRCHRQFSAGRNVSQMRNLLLSQIQCFAQWLKDRYVRAINFSLK